MNRVFVTGATGLVGSQLVALLSVKGYKVTVLVRNKAKVKPFPEVWQISYVEGDLNDLEVLAKTIAETDAVFHCAAMVSFNRRKKEELFDINVTGTQNIVNTCCKYGKYLSYVSSIAAIGRTYKEPEITEKNTWVESELNSMYAESKYYAEQEVWRGIEEGLQASIVNPSVIFGPSDWTKSSTKLFKYCYDQKPFYTDGYLNWIDVRDVVEAMVYLYEQKISGERYILSSERVYYKTFFEEVAGRMNKKPPYIKVNKPIAYMAWIYESFKSFVTGKEPLVTKDITKMAQTRFVYHSDKYLKLTGKQFRTLEQSLDWICPLLLQENKVVDK